MRQFQLAGTTICINEADMQEVIYVSVTFGVGFAPRWIHVNGDNVEIGSAAAKVFGNYIQTLLETTYHLHTQCTVTIRAMSFIWKTTQDDYVHDIQMLLDALYEDIDEHLFLEERTATIERYKQNYKDIEFRGWMKMLEFSHENKSFQLDQLSKDLLDVSVPNVMNLKKYLLAPENMYLFCHGKADEQELKKLVFPDVPTYQATYLFDLKENAFRQDQEFVKASKENFWCGCLRFERDPIVTDLSKEYVVMQFIGDMLFGDSFVTRVDALDVSIIYDQKTAHLKESFQELITKQNVLTSKKRIYHWLEKELSQAPEQWMEKVGRLYVSQVHFFECMSYLEKVDVQDIQLFLETRDYQLREGFVRYYKEGERYVT